MRILVYFSLIILLGSCSIIKNTPKYDLVDGVYQLNHTKVLVEVTEDTLHLISKSTDVVNVEKTLPPVMSQSTGNLILRKGTFDLDLLAIPVKIHGSVNGIPTQMNTEINASVYFGKRSDRFYIRYNKTPRSLFKREIDHFGLSYGAFLGFGSTAIHQGVSQSQITYDYQGIVFSKGLAGIIAINNFTLGIAYGFDQLMDENASKWIYQQKPYWGIAIGLNLN
ncbi:hypothetical protein [Aquirufa ecclesiirivi]|uniref:hypothetical protein n=1 Tax=Aquirufa ecclesiirivi TaxID=2715124 RepID=UPI00140816A3|nr:hypothetical protein [Aquirufa ecclesiirivi]NHC48841.1 hypothetical protein [Aquirufa ecclesiirivi]